LHCQSKYLKENGLERYKGFARYFAHIQFQVLSILYSDHS